MRFEFAIGPEHVVQFRYNPLLASVQIRIDNRPFYYAITLVGRPVPGTNGMCPGEGDGLQELISRSDITWTFSISETPVRIVRHSAPSFPSFKRTLYTAEVGGCKVLERCGR